MTEKELKLIEYMARDGMSFEEIKKQLGITEEYWEKYFSKHGGERERLKNLKAVTDYQVEDALLKRALGYSCEEHREVEKPGGSECTTTKKEVSPDVSAAALWLKFRRAGQWNEKCAGQDDSRMDEILRRLDEEAENA